jgi:hypothetical protein
LQEADCANPPPQRSKASISHDRASARRQLLKLSVPFESILLQLRSADLAAMQMLCGTDALK